MEKNEEKKPFEKQFEEHEKMIDEVKEKLPTIRERLMSRAKTLTLDVPFEDEDGEFTVKCRILTQAEQDQAISVLGEFEKLKNDKMDNKVKFAAYNKALKHVYALLAYPEGLCREAEMTLEFWESGVFTVDVPFYILQYVMKEMGTAIQNARLFRGKQ